METKLTYELDKYIISQKSWDPQLSAKTESMMSLGNGYLGIRSVDEEEESFNKEDFFVNGVFNKESLDEVSELANLADLIQNTIYIDGKRFSLKREDQYLKKVNLKNGILSREIRFSRENKKYHFTFERFVSQHNNHLYGQRIILKQLSGKNSEIIVFPKINGQTTNGGSQHFAEGQKKRPTLNSLQYLEKTIFSQRLVIHNMVLDAKIGNKKIKLGSDDYVLTMARRQVGFKIRSSIDSKNTFTLTKLMTVNTSIDDDKSLKSEKHVINQANNLLDYILKSSYDLELKQSHQAWEKIWSNFLLEIKGTSERAKYDSMANVFSIFHMNSFVPKNNPNLSVGAKGLSGEGYQGHGFWDTEFFILPNYLMTNPQIARNLLEYRYRGIEGARAKALETKERTEESNLKGAQFPWEMAWPTDGEVCPYWGQADIVSGEQVPIASRRQEIHVSADIAYAVHQYYDFTKDHSFMKNMGYELIFDTAIFWANRAEKQVNGSYEINDVMGPNEYKGNINNSAYINAFAKFNLDLALSYREKLLKTASGKKILADVVKKIPYKFSFKNMETVSKNLKQQTSNKEYVIAENDQFLSLKRRDVSDFQLLGDAGKKLFNTQAGQKLLESQLVKQADVVLLTYLLPNLFSKKEIESNFNFYEPITTHDSSLSPTTYAIKAIDLRKMDLAYKLYKYSLDIDLGNNMHSCDAGIHSGAIASIWQTTVFGYGGLRWIDNELHFNPVLPKQWDSLKYKIQYQGTWIEVFANKKSFTIKTLNGKKLNVIINGRNELISRTQIRREVTND